MLSTLSSGESREMEGEEMKKESVPNTIIRTTVTITAGELLKLLKVKGEIGSIHLLRGRSPNDIEKGISADTDEWEIIIVEGVKK